MPRSSPSLSCRTFFLVLFLATSAVLADIQGGGTGGTGGQGIGSTPAGGYAPVVGNIGVQIERGSRSEFEIDATAATPGQLQFLLRSKPAIGTIEGPFAIDGEPHRARFRYTAPREVPADRTQFSYAAKVPGGRISASAKVIIFFIDPLASLEVPRSLDFGDVVVGSGARATLRVRNGGKAEWNGPLTLDGPFSIPSGITRLRIGSGQFIDLPLLFAPGEKGRQSGAVTFGDPEDRQVAILLGEGTPPFTLEPVEAALESQRDGSRIARALLTNNSAYGAQVRMTGDPRLQMEETVILPPKDQASVAIVLPPTDRASFRGLVTFRLGEYEEELLVSGQAAPAELVVASAELLDFGTVELGNSALKTVVIENRGGEAAVLRLDSLPPFHAEIPGTDGELLGGSKQRIAIRMEAEHAGVFRRLLVGRWGDRVIEIPLQVTILDPEQELPPIVLRNETWIWNPRSGEKVGSAGPAEDFDSGVPASRRIDFSKLSDSQVEKLALLTVVGRSLEPTDYQEDVASAGRPFLQNVGTDFLEIGVVLPSPVPAGFIFQASRMAGSPETGLLEKQWYPIPKETPIYRLDDQTMVARVEGLKPNTFYEYRVICVDENTRTSYPSLVGRFKTTPERNIPWGWAVLALIAGLVGYVLWRRRREDEMSYSLRSSPDGF